ncbi:unnamed protein product [Cuscuta europaea]|uniref:Uncharacterized protein n=2 Tax=Cuscuta europaea TaxID=41803 RepID=A0A9P1EMH8_CUSEU|nr:unnamed protein product [Cuscuta europaea]
MWDRQCLSSPNQTLQRTVRQGFQRSRIPLQWTVNVGSSMFEQPKGPKPDPFFKRFEYYTMLAKCIMKPDEASRCELKESTYCPSFTAKPPRESILATPELTIIHAGESEDESESSSEDESESSSDCINLSLSIPSPPPYDDMEYYNPSPSPPVSPRKIQEEMELKIRIAEEEHGACHVKEGGQFREIHYRAAKEALEWYNYKNNDKCNMQGTQFKLLKMVELDFAFYGAFIFFITMKAVDDKDPTCSAVTFFAKYYHRPQGVYHSSCDEVEECYPIS